MTLEIIYQDEHLVAINKPNGLMVHRSKIGRNASVFAMQLLRDQLGCYVYPIHRLDRKTSGVLLFALDKKSASELQKTFAGHEHTYKRYLAIVRGYFPEEPFTLDYTLTNDDGKEQNAITSFRFLQHTELPLPFGKHQTSRYSLIEACPKTGRMHQIRKHCSHLNYPIIGDRPHGCNKQNKLFKERWDMTRMLLHAMELRLPHPITGEKLILKASLPEEFMRMYKMLLFENEDVLSIVD